MVERSRVAPADGGQASRTCARTWRGPSLNTVRVAVVDSPSRTTRATERVTRSLLGEGAAMASRQAAVSTTVDQATIVAGRGTSMTSTTPATNAHTVRMVRYTPGPPFLSYGA